MGLMQRLWPWGRKLDNGTLDLFRDVFGGEPSKSGQSVNYKTALQVATVFAVVRVLADGVAQVPLKLIRESADGRNRSPAKDLALYRVLHRRPNDWQTSFEFRETLMLHTTLCGNFYAFKNRVRGEIRELIPFEPGQVTVKRERGGYALSYEVRGDNGAQMTFPAEAIWHVRGPSWNTWMGLEVVKLAREAIGLALATEEHHAALHKNGAKPGGLLSVEGNLSEDKYKSLKAWVEENYEGSHNAWRTMIMDRAAKFTSLAMTGVDAEHLATRGFQIGEICRPFRVQPIMIGYSDKAATYASAEQMFLSHVVHTMSPWYERLEQSIDVNLLSAEEQASGVSAKFIEEGLLRGDLKTTAEYLTKMTTNGVMTRNEARAKLDLDALPGLDEPLTPANMTVGAEPAAAAADPSADSNPPKNGA